MKVALDATPLTVSTGGITRYAAELARALALAYPQDDYSLLSDQPAPLPADAPPNLRLGLPSPGLTRRRWWSLGLPLTLLRQRFQVFHGTDFSVPYLAVCPAVMTLHDLSPWRDPAWHRDAERVRRRTPALLRTGLATLVITPTEAIGREARDYFGLPRTRVVAVPLAASPVFRPVTPAPRPRPYFLYTGVLEPRKNLDVAIRAWREIRTETAVDLVLAGRRRPDWIAPPPAPGLDLRGEVTDDELAALHSGAIATLYPSAYEGFGLPVLEAMQCGAPVIVSRDPALAEVAADAALRLDAHDTAAWAEAMRAMIANPELRDDLARRGLARAREFSWARTARLTRDVYLEAIERFGG